MRRGTEAAARTLAALGFTEVVKIDGAFPSNLKVTFDRVAPHGDEVFSGTARVSRNGRVVGTAKFKKPKGTESRPWVGTWVALIPGAVIVGASVNINDGCGGFAYDDVLRVLLPPAAEPAH